MCRWFEKHLAFSRRELNGLATLAVCLTVVWVLPHLLDRWSSPEPDDLSTEIAEIEAFLATARPAGPDGGAPSPTESRPVRRAEFPGRSDTVTGSRPQRFPPDPAGSERFRRTTAYDRFAGLMIELNLADSLDLDQLPGIGPVLASRIVRYRDRLGGFHRTDQLLEVYGIDSARYEGLCPYVRIDSTRVHKIALNTAGYDELRRHPYIGARLANAIVQYRRQHGPYQSLSDLLQIVLIDERIFRNIVPYLTLFDD